MTQVLRREIESTPWDIVPKDSALKDDPPSDVQSEIEYVKFFLNDCNPNHESIETIISMACQDLLELDAGAFVKGFTQDSYITTPAGGLELAPRGQRQLVELWARDGGSFLAETDVNGVKYRWWQYSYLHPAVAPIEFDINEISYFMQYPAPYSVYGWCCAPDSLVETNPEVKTIEEIGFGDYVLTGKGTYEQVGAKFKRHYEGEMMIIHANGLPAIKTTPEHFFLIKRDKPRQKRTLYGLAHRIRDEKLEPIWVQAKDLNPKTDVLLTQAPTEIVDLDYVSFKNILHEQGKGKGKNPRSIPTRIPLTSEMLELFGLYLAEGSVDKHGVTFSFNPKETGLIEKTKSAMTFFGVPYWFGENRGCVHLVYSSRNLVKFFEQFYSSTEVHRAHTKLVPQWIMLLPPEKQKIIIRGMWEGDGSKYAKGFSYKTVSEKMVWQLRTLLLRSNIYASITPCKGVVGAFSHNVGRNSYLMRVSGYYVAKMCHLLAQSNHVVRRKTYSLTTKDTQDQFLVPINRIEREPYSGLVYDITVPNAGNFTLGGVISHNSPLQSLDNVLSSLINSAAWNTNFFSEATMPSGLIGVPGLNPEELERFRQYFRTEIKGRWHRIAVVNQDVKYVPFALTNRDMQWLDGQQWYIKIVAMLYNVTPTELGLTDDIRATGKAMGAQEDVFKRKSIMPILRKLEQVINNTIISELAQKVMFQYKPTDRSEELMQIDVDNKDIELGKKKSNEVRQTRGLGGPTWWGEEPKDIILARIARGEPIPPLQLPHPAQAPHAGQQTPELQRDVGKLPVEVKSVDPYEEAFNNVQQRHETENATETGQSKAWPPITHDQTGTAHTQDDTLPHTQNDSARENRPYKGTSVETRDKEISGNRIGWGKEQREDYVGQQSETIPGASDRGQLPTAIGRKPGESDNRAVGINPTDVGGSAGAYPIKSDRIQHDAKKPVPSAMGTRSVKGPTEEPRFYPGAANNATRLGTDSTEKPYDDTIDPKAARNRPVDDQNAQARIIPGDPTGGYGQHPWENDSMNDDVMHGHRTGVDQSQNPAYRMGSPPDSRKGLDSQASISHVTTDEQAIDTSKRETALTGTKQVQPPDSDRTGVTQFPTSHIQRDDDENEDNGSKEVRNQETKDFVATPTTPQQITDSQLQNQPTHPAKYRQPEHDQGNPQLDPLNAGNPPMEAGPRDTLDEYQLDRLRHGPAGPAATTPKGAWRYPGPEEGSAGRELIEGEAQDSVMTTRKAKPAPGATGYLREPTSDTPMHQDLPKYYGDQNPLHQFGEDNLRPSQLPDDVASWFKEKRLDLSNKLRDQIERFGKFTGETKKEFGALVIRKAGEILLDQVQVGEDHAINIEPTRPLGPDEEILGSYHQHPESNEFSPWDMTSFLNSQWEKCMILNAADGSIIVAIKTPQTKPLAEKPEDVREQYEDWSNPQFAKAFGFILYHGSVDDLNEVM